ncbi:L asparaginase [Trichuris trichiura]|uniref:asparaginase n=1 Tax=Trichuris trichiura TaxID=36087 RepID=A0A077Z9B8_TRITR|nr:L asparaginase [Trichuris trichiura]
MSISPGKLESKVLVLYTGGTIGMQSQNKVYVPVANYLLNAIRNDQSLNDKSYIEKHYRFEENLCVLPPVRGENRRVLYRLIEYEPLLDSCNMSFMEWTRIAKNIHDCYESYDGFVILHGTDTLCYTASALSFMFEDLGKPIVLTGSQIPISEVRCDGRENLVGSLIIAGNYDIPEVTICFNSLLLRGNRTTKFDCAGLSAFESPNVQPLARMGIQVNVKWDAVFRSRVRSKVFVRYGLDRNIALLRIFPAIPRDCVIRTAFMKFLLFQQSLLQFRAFFQPPIRGVVLQTFGAGNMPSHRDDLIDVIHEAVRNGLIVVNCSQCLRGRVDPAYETGRILIDAGVLYGSDLTVEAALTKLAYVLGRADLSLCEKKALMSQNIRGELTVAMESHIGRDHELVTKMAACLNLTTTQELRLLRELMYPMLVYQAVCQGNIRLLKSLKSGGAVLTCVDYMRRTSLHYAAALGELEMVQFLLSEGVSVHTKDNSNSTPLLEAIRGHHIAIVELLRKSGAHLTIEPLNLCANLAMAAASNDLDSMKSWKSAEANLSVADWEGRTALHVAASVGNEEMVSYLLDNGVSPFSTDHTGHSALDKALLSRHNGCAKLIRQFMANQANSD